MLVIKTLILNSWMPFLWFMNAIDHECYLINNYWDDLCKLLNKYIIEVDLFIPRFLGSSVTFIKAILIVLLECYNRQFN